MGKKKKVKFSVSASVASKGFNKLTESEAIDLQNEFAKLFAEEEAGGNVDFSALEKEVEREAEISESSFMDDLYGAMEDDGDDIIDDNDDIVKKVIIKEANVVNITHNGVNKKFAAPASVASDAVDTVIKPIDAEPKPASPLGVYGDDFKTCVLEMKESIASLVNQMNQKSVEIGNRISNALKDVKPINVDLSEEFYSKLNDLILSVNHMSEKVDNLNINNCDVNDNAPTVDTSNSSEPVLDIRDLLINEPRWWNCDRNTMTVRDKYNSTETIDFSGVHAAAVSRYDLGDPDISEWMDIEKAADAMRLGEIFDAQHLRDALRLECIQAVRPTLIISAEKFMDTFGKVQKIHPNLLYRLFSVKSSDFGDVAPGPYVFVYFIADGVLGSDIARFLKKAQEYDRTFTFANKLFDVLEAPGFQFTSYDIKAVLDESLSDKGDAITDMLIDYLDDNGSPFAVDENESDYVTGYIAALVKNNHIITDKMISDNYEKLYDTFKFLRKDFDDEDDFDYDKDYDDVDEDEIEEVPDYDVREYSKEDSSNEAGNDPDVDFAEASDDAETVYSDSDNSGTTSPFADIDMSNYEYKGEDDDARNDAFDAQDEPDIEDVDDASTVTIHDEEKPKDEQTSRFIFTPLK